MNPKNDKYEITDIAHEKSPFLHRIRALRDIGDQVQAGELGGFVESERNLSFEPEDDAWIFDEAIACNDAYVDQDAVLLETAVVCDKAYVSQGAMLCMSARAEDESYVRGAVLTDNVRVAGAGMVLADPDSGKIPIVRDQCVIYGTIMGDVRVGGGTVVFSQEAIRNDTRDTWMIQDGKRMVERNMDRIELTPLKTGSVKKRQTKKLEGKQSPKRREPER